jgi:hypothetical protein
MDDITRIRLQVMQSTVDTGTVPDAGEVAHALGILESDVREAFQRLHDSHVFVLEPGAPNRLRMANPFSAVPTGFRASVGGRSWYGNCVWDGLGIIAMLGGEGVLATHCPENAEPLAVGIANRTIAHGSGVAYIGVPARAWWENIIYT